MTKAIGSLTCCCQRPRFSWDHPSSSASTTLWTAPCDLRTLPTCQPPLWQSQCAAAQWSQSEVLATTRGFGQTQLSESNCKEQVAPAQKVLQELGLLLATAHPECCALQTYKHKVRTKQFKQVQHKKQTSARATSITQSIKLTTTHKQKQIYTSCEEHALPLTSNANMARNESTNQRSTISHVANACKNRSKRAIQNCR